MKKWLSLILLVVSINGFSQVSSSANEGPVASINVILSITHNDKNIIDPVKSMLRSMNGVSILAYCDGHAVFMIALDNTIYRDRNDFYAELKKQYPKTQDQLSFKDGDFKEFMQHCQPSDTQEAETLKKLSTN
jgi:hypothetical protein